MHRLAQAELAGQVVDLTQPRLSPVETDLTEPHDELIETLAALSPAGWRGRGG
jgi:hypothetical protein